MMEDERLKNQTVVKWVYNIYDIILSNFRHQNDVSNRTVYWGPVVCYHCIFLLANIL